MAKAINFLTQKLKDMSDVKSLTEKPLMGTVVSLAIVAGVLFVAAWAVSKGYAAGKK